MKVISERKDECYNKLGCASVKLYVCLEFLKVLSDLIAFGWWLTMLEIMGDHSLEAG